MIFICVVITGCVTTQESSRLSQENFIPPKPASMEILRTTDLKYGFLYSAKFRDLENMYMLYDTKNLDDFKLSAYMTSPKKTLIKFFNNKEEYAIPDIDGRALKLGTGVYPFEIYPFPTADAGLPKNSHLSGAMVVLNLDNFVELASFGKSPETIMFKEEMIKKALNGTLTEGVISFDEKPRILYWVGNRQNTFFGGSPTAEVDFSKNSGIIELKINGITLDNFVGTVDIYKETNNNKSTDPEKKINEFYIKFANGNAYKGYIRNIEENATTAFVKIPCTIPASLLEAATKGTISKLNIHSDGTEKETVAELVFGYSQ